MSKIPELENRIRSFFGYSSDSEPYEKWETLAEQTAHLVDEYGWNTVQQAFFRYVRTECKTPDDIARVAFAYEGLGWNKKPVPNSYEFLGYLYYKAGFQKAPYEAARALDDLCITVLPASGYPEANIYYHPYYAAEADPKMIDAVECWRQRESGKTDEDGSPTNDSKEPPENPKQQENQ